MLGRGVDCHGPHQTSAPSRTEASLLCPPGTQLSDSDPQRLQISIASLGGVGSLGPWVQDRAWEALGAGQSDSGEALKVPGRMLV